MRRIAHLFLVLLCVTATAQENRQEHPQRRFSQQEFQEHQRKFISEQAKLTQEEADAFFPLFFELQKKKQEINKASREKAGLKRGERPTEEMCILMVNDRADAKVKIAQLEKEYIALYLKAIPAEKILHIQFAEERFQREILKKMSNGKQMQNGRPKREGPERDRP